MVNVKDFGAMGNGTVDDGPAIRNALAADLGVYFPKGTYKVRPDPLGDPVNALPLRTGHHIFGDGSESKVYLDSGGTQPLYANVVALKAGESGNLLIENLRIEGINKSNLVANGNGIYLTNCKNIIIRDCFFAFFGDPSLPSSNDTGCAIVGDAGVQNILISGNHITGGLGLNNASDILLNFTSGASGPPGFATIVNNFCLSANSQGIFVNAGNGTAGKIVITGNVCWNKLRHGIAAMYANVTAQQYVDTIVANNVCYNCGWTGIYFAGGTDLGSGGTTTIVGNVVEYCGGDNTAPSVSLHAGILVTDNLPPVLVAHNYIRKSGYLPDGTRRGFPARGIGVYNQIEVNNNYGELTIDGNVIEQCFGYGIYLYNLVTVVSIKNNTLLDNEGQRIVDATDFAQISVIASPTPPPSVIRIDIVNNKIQLVTQNTDGIRFAGVYGNPKVVIRGNSLMGLKQGPNPPDPNIGINLIPNPATGDHTTGVIQGNVIDNWDQAIYLDATERSALLPVKLWIANNVLSNNAQGVVYYPGPYNNTNYGFIFHNLLDSSPTDTGSAAQGVKHAISATPNLCSGLANRLVFFDSVAPTAQPITGTNWSPGTIVFNTNPVAAGKIGWVYTAGGTWQQFGAIDS
jgi:hypothetical protein